MWSSGRNFFYGTKTNILFENYQMPKIKQTNINISKTLSLKVIYKGFFKSFIVLYDDRICPEHHFVENRIENFPSV